jgi:hypothetical protein
LDISTINLITVTRAFVGPIQSNICILEISIAECHF